MSVSFLTPLAALVGLVGLLAAWAVLTGRRRSAAVGTALGLPAAGPRATVIDLVLLALVAGLVALAAAQPVVARSEATVGREGAEVLVVMDVDAVDACAARTDRADQARPGARDREAIA